MPFDSVPLQTQSKPESFRIFVEDEALNEFQSLVKLSRVGPSTYEGTQTERNLGVRAEWILKAKEYMLEKFDWRATEARLNTFPQYIYQIDGMQIHFMALFSLKKKAIPIVFLHGWPGSFIEFTHVFSLFQEQYTPASLPYHLVAPSLPGFAFSSGPPLDRDFSVVDVGSVINQLMVRLGFGDGYVAQGGDIGSRISRVLAVKYDSCKAVHVNYNFMTKPESVSAEFYSALEKQQLSRYTEFAQTGSAYVLEHATRPNTIGHVVSSNPLALLSWIGEKFLDWSDEPLPLSTIVESVALYWFTETFSRSIYPYRSNYPPPPIAFTMDPQWYIHKPFGFSYFPMEISPTPRSWVATTGNLVFHRAHDKGGHFAALEGPEVFKEDIIEFVKQVWHPQRTDLE